MADTSPPTPVCAGGYSIFRGHSRTGLGEGPGRPISHGEQYIAAHEPLRSDVDLLTLIRPWMTLDSSPADEQALGTRLEGWSYVALDGWVLVVRLVGAGLYDRRSGYFAHGRAWPATFAGACDPGGHFGHAAAFRGSSSDPDTLAALAPLEDGGPPTPAVPTDADAAIRLIASLYQSRVVGVPVVMAVPLASFAAGGTLAPLVGFARAALPLSLKRDLAIRIYTRLPDYYLRHLVVNALIIPEDDAPRALAVRRDAMLLDHTARRLAGAEPTAGVLRYAEAVVKAASETPNGLLAFSARVDRRAWVAAPAFPSETDAEEVPFVYRVASLATAPADMEQFLHKLFNTLNARPVAIAWNDILTDDDIAICGKDHLIDIILSEAKTVEARTLQDRAEAALAPGTIPDGRIQRWWHETPADVGRIERLARFLNRQLVSTQAVITLVAGAPAKQLVEAGAASHDTLSPLMGLIREGLDPEWLEDLVDIADTAMLIAVIEGLVPTGVSAAVRPVVAACIARLIEHPIDAADDQEHLAKVLPLVPSPSPAVDLPGYLALAELWYRIARVPDDPAERFKTLTSRADRRYVVKLAGDRERWTWLAGFEPPESWDDDAAKELIDAEGAHPRRSLERILEIGDHLSRDDRDSQEALARLIDGAMRTDPKRGAAGLIAAGRWNSWRSRASLTREEAQRQAGAWLMAVRQPGGSRHVRFEDVVRVFEDLGHGLTRDDAQIVKWIDDLDRTKVERLLVVAARAIDADLWILAVFAYTVDRPHAPELSRMVCERLEARLRTRPTAKQPEVVRDILAWLCRVATHAEDIPEPLAALLERLVKTVGVTPLVVGSETTDRDTSPPAIRARTLAQGFREAGRARLADAFEERPLDPPDQVLRALAEGAVESPLWARLASPPRPFALPDAPRVVSEAARRGRGTANADGTSRDVRWLTFCAVARRHPQWLSEYGGVVPALQLGAALRPNAALGDLAAELVDIASHASADGMRLDTETWLGALVNTFSWVGRFSGWRSGSHWREAAVAVLMLHLKDPRHRKIVAAVLAARSEHRRGGPSGTSSPSLDPRAARGLR